MANIFITSDHHFSHAGILKFLSPVGLPLRDFPDVQTMDDFMIEQWNAVVKPSDKVYHLGDFAMRKPAIAIAGRLHGKKRLVRGNHDTYPTKAYLEFFQEIYGSRLIDGLLLSHIPLKADSIHDDWTNVHGHVHNNVPQWVYGPQYCNVCVEYTDYRPLAIEEVKQRIARARTAFANGMQLFDLPGLCDPV